MGTTRKKVNGVWTDVPDRPNGVLDDIRRQNGGKLASELPWTFRDGDDFWERIRSGGPLTRVSRDGSSERWLANPGFAQPKPVRPAVEPGDSDEPGRASVGARPVDRPSAYDQLPPGTETAESWHRRATAESAVSRAISQRQESVKSEPSKPKARPATPFQDDAEAARKRAFGNIMEKDPDLQQSQFKEWKSARQEAHKEFREQHEEFQRQHEEISKRQAADEQWIKDFTRQHGLKDPTTAAIGGGNAGDGLVASRDAGLDALIYELEV